MNLFTASGKKVNAIKLTDAFDNSDEWDVHSLTVDDIPMTAFTAPTGKASQYRFMWGGDWYRIVRKLVEELVEEERLQFFTENPLSTSKKEYDTFIILTRVPEVKGMFVGTVLRGYITGVLKNATCNTPLGEISVPKDYYRFAEPAEIYSYIMQRFNGLVFIKKGKDEGEIRELKLVIKGRSGTIFAHTIKGDTEEETAISYMKDPTDNQLFKYYAVIASSKQLEIGSTVRYMEHDYIISGYDLNTRKQPVLSLKRGGKGVEALMGDVHLVQTAIPTEDGPKLANYFISMIDKKDFLDSLDDQVKESFFRIIKEWSTEHHKSCFDEGNITLSVGSPPKSE